MHAHTDYIYVRLDRAASGKEDDKVLLKFQLDEVFKILSENIVLMAQADEHT